MSLPGLKDQAAIEALVVYVLLLCTVFLVITFVITTVMGAENTGAIAGSAGAFATALAGIIGAKAVRHGN